MIIRKKTIFLVALVFLLVVVGYVNHHLTKQSLLQSSNEYQRYEESRLRDVIYIQDDDTIEASGEVDEATEDIDDIEIVDSRTTEVDNMAAETSKEIAETITKEESLKSSNYFIEYRLSRDKLRASLVDRLNEIISNERSSDDMINQSQGEIIRIGELAEKELYLEGLIKAQGFEDALVFLDKESARIVVSTEELKEQDVMRILELVRSETSIEASNIKIMKKL